MLSIKTFGWIQITTNIFDHRDNGYVTDRSVGWDNLRAGDSKYAVIEFDVDPLKRLGD